MTHIHLRLDLSSIDKDSKCGDKRHWKAKAKDAKTSAQQGKMEFPLKNEVVAGASGARQNVVLFIVVLGTLMGALDATIVLLAFPTITDALHSDFITALWIILVYLLIIAVTTTQFGRVGDVYGRSRIFNIGFALFTAGSAFCGFSINIGSLIASRALQAIGGAIMQATSGAIIADHFPRNSRGRAYGFNALGWTAGSMLGIVLGGAITTFIGWQYIFFINVPIGIFAVAFGWRYLRDGEKVKAKMDLPGIVLLASGLCLLTFGLTGYAAEALTVPNSAMISVGLALLFGFVVVERRAKSPTIDFSSFQDRILRNASLSSFFVSLGYLSVVFLVIMYLQGVRGLSPMNASLLLIPGYVVGSFLGPVMGRLSDKFGSRTIATFGIIFMGVASLVFLALRQDTSLYIVLIGSALSGVGTSMFFPANSSAVMASAKSGQYGSISGLLRTLQNVGILGSFVMAISIASASIPRDLAFQIFLGTGILQGGVSDSFIEGIDSALYASLVLLVISGLLSWSRGKEVRTGNAPVNQGA